MKSNNLPRRAFVVCLCLLCAAIFPSCGKTPSAGAIFSDFAARYGLPEGIVYDSEASPDDPRCLSRETFAALYARPDGSDDREDVESCVVWLSPSSARVGEAAIFVCRDRERAERVCGLCERRLALLRSLSACADVSAADDAVILMEGRTVGFFVLPDNPRAERIFHRIA